MIEWVYRRARKVKLFDKVIVATDDTRIMQAVHDFGGQAELTPSDLPSGTDRVAFLARNMDADVYVNLQGDEPLISPQLLEDVCAVYSDHEVVMTTAVSKINTVAELTDPNLVRVTLDNQGNTLYFTRAVIPYLRDEPDVTRWLSKHFFYRHIGIYTYRGTFLSKISGLPPGTLEKAERLEQLRILENGYKIRAVITTYHSLCVDTPEDLHQVENFIKLNKLRVDD